MYKTAKCLSLQKSCEELQLHGNNNPQERQVTRWTHLDRRKFLPCVGVVNVSACFQQTLHVLQLPWDHSNSVQLRLGRLYLTRKRISKWYHFLIGTSEIECAIRIAWRQWSKESCAFAFAFGQCTCTFTGPCSHPLVPPSSLLEGTVQIFPILSNKATSCRSNI